MRPSSFNILEPWRGRWIVFNSLNGRAVAVGTTVMSALRSGKLDRLPRRSFARLEELGFVVEDQIDERTQLLDVRWPSRTADVTVLGSGTGGDDRSVEAALDFILDRRRRGEIDQAKLRLCSGGAESIASRGAALAAVREACEREGVTLVAMWTAEQLEEARSVAGVSAEAFFFRWELGRAGSGSRRAVLEAARDLVAQGKSIVIQLAISRLDEIERCSDTIRWAARQPELVRGGRCLWDVTVASEEHPVYFLPSVCLEFSDPAFDLLATARDELSRLGIRVRPAIAPYRMHPGCPFRFALARAYDERGGRIACLLDAKGPWRCDGEALSQDAVSRKEQVERCGTSCALLPFCLARCPRMDALVPESPSCANRKRMIEQELRRMLVSGLVPIARLDSTASDDEVER